MIAVAFYGFLFYSLILYSPKMKTKVRWTGFSIVFILLLGFSRLYLGVHCLSDVLVGYSFGLLWLLLAISILEWFTYGRKPISGEV